ncbi:hypothetical protein TRIUR3_18121 [Triticum urartu]|uniref:Uncharacterized protein n=1 Tax=Triticum urartu TaxID=4572 RepID=M7YYC2_TRIUA|nr:hypothetical protein TRIUR3_18121 [Triticum urartu]
MLRLLVIWAAILGSCHGQSEVSRRNSRLRVMSPPELEGTYGCASTDFGFPQHAGSMTGVVVYPRRNRMACMNFDDFGISLRSRPAGALPVILLVDTGGISNADLQTSRIRSDHTIMIRDAVQMFPQSGDKCEGLCGSPDRCHPRF